MTALIRSRYPCCRPEFSLPLSFVLIDVIGAIADSDYGKLILVQWPRKWDTGLAVACLVPGLLVVMVVQLAGHSWSNRDSLSLHSRFGLIVADWFQNASDPRHRVGSVVTHACSVAVCW